MTTDVDPQELEAYVGNIVAACEDRERAEAERRAAIATRQRWQAAAHRELPLSMQTVADLTIGALEARGWSPERIEAAGVGFPAVRRAVEQSRPA